MLAKFVALGLLCSALACDLRPRPDQSRFPKSPGDNFFKLIISGDTERYQPGELYTVTLVGSRTHNRVQQFSRFRLTASPATPGVQRSPRLQGQFHLFADTLSQFDDQCINTVIETDDLPKTEVQVMWKAPKEGSGCVLIQAMVLEDARNWYAEDGQLSYRICEDTSIEQRQAAECCACDEAKYTMVFEGLWSNKTHPKDFPTALWLTHFSDVIGATHITNFSFWGEGQIATPGFRSLAEWGSAALLERELRQHSGNLKNIVKAPGLWYPRVNSNTTGTFSVDRRRHLLSVASMFGPSPDWVVGVDNLELCRKDCTWEEDLVIELRPYDAGTDSGISYMSPNAETLPREKMYRITPMYPEDPRAPFYDPGAKDIVPLARLHLKRSAITPHRCDEEVLEEQLTPEVAENAETIRPECGVTPWSQWSECSVPCGKGLRMRTREYLMPQKAQMFSCDRQLVTKEMCVAAVPECEGGVGVLEDLGASGAEAEAVCRTGEWSAWSECSATCGVGVATRQRHFLDRAGIKRCPLVNLVEKQKCMRPACAADEIEVQDPMCPTTEWSDWSPCSATCGPGVKLRTRLLLVQPELQQKCSMRMELVQQRPCIDQESCAFDMATAKQVCMEEQDPGQCRGVFNRWTFVPQKLMCIPFVYTGCRGNRNNFLTREECTASCQIVIDVYVVISSPSVESVL